MKRMLLLIALASGSVFFSASAAEAQWGLSNRYGYTFTYPGYAAPRYSYRYNYSPYGYNYSYRYNYPSYAPSYPSYNYGPRYGYNYSYPSYGYGYY